jgi:integrase/recombinase XerD
MWKQWIRDFLRYLKLERGLSANTLAAYRRDVEKLALWAEENGISPDKISTGDLRNFLQSISSSLTARSQARVVSGIRTFFTYLLEDNYRKDHPAEMLSLPRLGTYLPDVLSISEIDKIIAVIDRSKPEGERNLAIIETMYACGLRVSELVGLHLSDLHFDRNFIRVRGKGNKERLVPIHPNAQKLVQSYIKHIRNHMDIDPKCTDIVFLNRRGKSLSRQMIFIMLKDLAERAGIQKNISPHTLRHSFATHLVQGGADLRVVQELLGHESILTTEIYSHLDQGDLRKTILKFHPRG